ncbi:hypothetical protein [Undibacterium sp. Ji49W]|uniref:hypothetical protein n=1 Tax=Undibacterium sp. Ji49W TaxID=3413040 RepID=UPI003BEFA877
MSKHTNMLLKLIQEGADSSFLLRQGLTFSQISILFGEILRDGLIQKDQNSFQLTDKGLAILSGSSNKYGGNGKWVFPDESYVIPQVPVDRIYLPKLKDSKFLGP